MDKRNTNAKCRICRRVGEKLYLKGEKCLSPKCPVIRRTYPPGIHGGKGYPRLSGFGQQLKEKQKARFMYGVSERQFAGYYKRAIKVKGDTGKKLLELLERRLDNVIFRSRIVSSRAQARQLVSHGHIQVNGKRVSIPSYLVKGGDVITFKPQVVEIPSIQLALKQEQEVPSWLGWDRSSMRIDVVSLPQPDEQSIGVNAKLIVEYYSR